MKVWIWIAGVLALVLLTLGLAPIIATVVYILLFAISALCVIAVVSMKNSPHVFNPSEPLPYPSNGIKNIVKSMKINDVPMKLDKRLTGANVIDSPLQEVLHYLLRDFIESWYSKISKDQSFLTHLRHSIQKMIVSFSNQAKEMDWVSFITASTVTEIVAHLKCFRVAVRLAEQEAVAKTKKDVDRINDRELAAAVPAIFLERWTAFADICQNKEREAEYLRDLAEVILYFLVPESDFESKALRFLLRELVASTCLKPTVDMVSDPDYVNQTINLWVSEQYIGFQTILDVIRTTQSVEDLGVIFGYIEDEIKANLESSSKNKQHVESILFAKRECENRHKELTGDRHATTYGVYEPSALQLDIPLTFFLENNNAMLFFQEFMESRGAKDILDFYVTAATFEIVSHLKVKDAEQVQLPALRAEISQQAAEIYSQYLGLRAPKRVALPAEQLEKVQKLIESSDYPETIFSSSQDLIFQELEQRYYPVFKKTAEYVRCQLEGDIAVVAMPQSPARPQRSTSYDTTSLDQESETNLSMDAESPIDAPFDVVQHPETEFDSFELKVDPVGTWQASIDGYQSQKASGSNSKNVTVYKLLVSHMSNSLVPPKQEFTIWRRFSDFDDVHRQIKSKLPQYKDLVLPEKTVFNVHSTEFLIKRKAALQLWLETALRPEFMENPDTREYLVKFLSAKAYPRREVNIATKLIRSVSVKVKEVTARKVSSKASESEYADALAASLSGYDPRSLDEDDTIPFKIILSLLDELFELERNQWLRRRIMSVLRHIIRAAMGDSINKRIEDSIDAMTSTEQVAQYVIKFRDSMWPGGVAAPPCPPREKDDRTKTRVEAKAKMLSMIPDDLKRLVGSQTAKKGMLRVLDMFQYTDLNKRLVYLTLEAFLCKLFPDSKIQEALKKLHDVKPKKL